MEGTTEEQNKIRRATLLISVLLLLFSGGAYFLYQHMYQTKLHVTITSKKVLPNTGAAKKSSKVEEKPETKTTELESLELNQEFFSEKQIPSSVSIKEKNLKTTNSKIFKLSNRIESLP